MKRAGLLFSSFLIFFGGASLASDERIPPPRNLNPGWTEMFDFDRDGRNDSVDVSYSGGAHCCYTIAVTLTSTGRTTRFPFELDGGYVAGLDFRRPEHFRVERDGRIFMEIATYGGQKVPIPARWRRIYGISTHHIVIEYRREKWVVRGDSRALRQR